MGKEIAFVDRATYDVTHAFLATEEAKSLVVQQQEASDNSSEEEEGDSEAKENAAEKKQIKRKYTRRGNALCRAPSTDKAPEHENDEWLGIK